MNILSKVVLILYCYLISTETTITQLVVNVKNQGGEVLQQTIQANTTKDTIFLTFKTFDGTIISQFIDFRNEVHIIKSTVLGEVEQGQNEHQVMCFVLRFLRNEFISADAMSKLRQKNPGAIRHPEEDKGEEKIELDLLIDVSQSRLISPHIGEMCHNARDTTFTRDNDLSILAKSLHKDIIMLLGATKRPALYKLQPCHQQQEPSKPCICRYKICVGWYPCGLKHCKGKDSTGKVVSYRCGIKTCRKCRLFQYYARQKLQCLWDDTHLYNNQTTVQPGSHHMQNEINDDNIHVDNAELRRR